MKIILQDVGLSVKYLQIALFLLVAMLCGYTTDRCKDTVTPVTVKSQFETVILSVLKLVCVCGAVIRISILYPVSVLVCFCLYICYQ